MGEIVGAAVLAHVPTIVLPDDVRRALNDGKESTLYTGLHEVRREVLDVLAPDLVVVFDSHWFTTVEFVVAAQARRTGRYTSEELPRGMSRSPTTSRATPSSPRRSAEADAIEDCWITAIDDEYLPDPLPDDQPPGLPPGRRALGVGRRRPDRPRAATSRPSGRCVARAVARSTGASFVIGSGALSHTFWPLRELRAHEAAGEEHIFTKEARAADHEVLDAWGAATTPRHRRDGRVHAVRPEGRFAHYLMMVGAIGGRDCTAPGRRYSAYENAIGTGQVHVVFDRPDQRVDGGDDVEGLPFPRTATGRASILPPAAVALLGRPAHRRVPHRPRRVRALLPDELDLPHDDEDPGAVAFIWADWQGCSDDGAELDDPIRSSTRRRSSSCVAAGATSCGRCVFIWVDKDFAMVRGHLQGYPKKLGSDAADAAGHRRRRRPATRGRRPGSA